MDTINIIQHGIDGFGHQLHGIFTTLVIHGIRNYNFDANIFINKQFMFQHIYGEEAEQMKQYLIECIRLFKEDNKIIDMRYNNHIHAHEIYNIPSNASSSTIYSLDNIFFFNKLNFNEDDQKQHKYNIIKYKNYFINSLLPPSRLDNNNIVIHIRMGDAVPTGRGDSIFKLNKQVVKLMEIFAIKYPMHIIYIHTDDNIDFLYNKGFNFIHYNKTTKLINVLSDMIHANILVCGNSSLSKVASFLGNKETIIIHDDNDQSMPDENVIKISEYINSNL